MGGNIYPPPSRPTEVKVNDGCRPRIVIGLSTDYSADIRHGRGTVGVSRFAVPSLYSLHLSRVTVCPVVVSLWHVGDLLLLVQHSIHSAAPLLYAYHGDRIYMQHD